MSISKVNLANIKSVPKGGFYLHRQMASCVLSASKPFSVPENDLPLAGEKRFRSQRFLVPSLVERAEGEAYWLAAVFTTKIHFVMKAEKKNPKGGRKPKTDPCSHRYAFNLNDVDNAAFLSLFDASGMKNKAHFITACIFGKLISVVKIDKAAMDYYMRLTTFHSQFRAIGVNYNQITKAIKATFTEKKALAFLFKLEKATMELVAINKQIIQLTEEFERQWLQK